MPRKARRGRRKFRALRYPTYFFCTKNPPKRKTKRKVFKMTFGKKSFYCTIGRERGHWKSIWFFANKDREYGEIPHEHIF